jgi:hypothetical protein
MEKMNWVDGIYLRYITTSPFFKVPLMFDYKSLFSSLDMLDFKYHDVIDDFLQ